MAERGMLPQLLCSCLWLKLQQRICSIATGGMMLEFHSRKRFLCSELPKLHSVYRKTWTLLEEDEGRRASWLFSHFHRPNLETNADIIHIKLLRNNTFVTVTDSKGNVKIKCKATSGSLPDLKGGRKMTSYTADATAENIGRRVKAMGLKSVVVKANGFTHFKKKRNAIVAFRSGYSSSRNDQNPIVYIEDTTRKAHNGCRLPRKCRV
ncbi:hypothetical protein F2Q68_00016666 [Brassica cretica]|uniref:Ribosomal protein S11 n=1 Tax=Brassica cretica TaxID=69181 RepID=A0A8S9HP34_BRACR|nr:hypothetical protein F2Q68_00016666 [Brassica cretica]